VEFIAFILGIVGHFEACATINRNSDTNLCKTPVRNQLVEQYGTCSLCTNKVIANPTIARKRKDFSYFKNEWNQKPALMLHCTLIPGLDDLGKGDDAKYKPENIQLVLVDPEIPHATCGDLPLPMLEPIFLAIVGFQCVLSIVNLSASAFQTSRMLKLLVSFALKFLKICIPFLI
jgi:hypothetical protein